jgi:hypothetical protein
MNEISKEQVEDEFPDWEAFQGVDRRWHARIRGAEAPLMVHDDDLLGLREEIQRENSKIEQRAWIGQHPPYGRLVRDQTPAA